MSSSFCRKTRRVSKAGRVQHNGLDQGQDSIGLVEDLERRVLLGKRNRIDRIVIRKSWLALSLICAIKGYKFICVTDPNANRRDFKEAWNSIGQRL